MTINSLYYIIDIYLDKRGNENEGEVYFERYNAFLEAFNNAKAANPELYDGIELIYSSGAFDATNSDNYKKAYDYAKEQLGE